MLATAARRHLEGAAAGRTAVSGLVHAAMVQLDRMIGDPTVGALARTDVDEGGFAEEVSAAVVAASSAPR